MFNLFKSKRIEHSPAKARFALIDHENETLLGLFETHDDVIEKKITLEIRTNRHLKVINV